MPNIFSNFNSDIREMEKPDFISQYRDSLMGIAILWIVFYHSHIGFEKSGFLSLLLIFLKATGYLGIDIFFFVSGFGLMVSWYKKSNKLFFFYKRRFLRIMPMYWFFLSIDLVISNLFGKPITNLETIFSFYTGLSFFISRINYVHWFISAILLCYLIFPFFGNSFQRNNNKLKFIGLIVGLSLTLAVILTISSFFFAKTFSYLLIAILRLPAFFMGSLIGYTYIKKDTSFSYLFSVYFNIFFTSLCFAVLALIFLFYSGDKMWLYGLYWYPFVLGSFSLTFLLSIFLDLLRKHFRCVLNILDKIGKSSLELYFIHLLVFEYIEFIFRNFAILSESNYSWFAAIFISVVLAIMFNRILSCLNTLFKYSTSLTRNV